MTRFGKVVSWIIAVVAFGILLSHLLKWDRLQVDWITISLLGFLLAVPFLELIRKIRIGEFEAEIAPREVAEVKAKTSIELPPAPKEESPEFEKYSSIVDLTRQDPQLGLAKLRIELEQTLKAFYEMSIGKETLRRPLSLRRMVDDLSAKDVIPPEIAATIRDVIPLANRAVHGEYVRTQDAEELALIGVRLLNELSYLYSEKVAKPIETKTISASELNRLESSMYKVTTVIPYTDKPIMNVRILSQEGLENLLEGYNEYAEFIVSVEPIDQQKS